MTSKEFKQLRPFLTLPLRSESDSLLARRRAKQIATLAGFDKSNQTRLATAVSECARSLAMTDGQARIDFYLEGPRAGLYVLLRTDDCASLSKEYVLSNVNAVQLLVDGLKIFTEEASIQVTLEKFLPDRESPFETAEIVAFSRSLDKVVHDSPSDVLHEHNLELVTALSQLDDLNKFLEQKVLERTQQLECLNVELVKARDQALHANDLKVQFLNTISHEIRTPLTGVLGLADLALTEADEEVRHELILEILNCGKQLTEVVEQLLDFSNLEAGKTEFLSRSFCIESVVREVRDSFISAATAKGLTVTTHLDSHISEFLVGDDEALKQVLGNLTNNAVKFTNEGQISIDVRKEREHDEKIFVRFTISDTGIGIQKENLDDLFVAFSQADGAMTRKFGGAGLGLSISKALVEKMSGAIGVESEIGIGSQFWIVLPFIPGAPFCEVELSVGE